MEGNLAGRSSTLSMHVSFEPEIPLAAIYSTGVPTGTRMFPAGQFLNMAA